MSKTEDSAPSSYRTKQFLYDTLGPLFALFCVLLTIYVADRSFANGTFGTLLNMRHILIHTCVVAVAALGMTLIIIAGGIDLSAGTAIAFCATVLAWGLREDVGFLITHGENFASVSQELVTLQQESVRTNDAGQKKWYEDQIQKRNLALQDIVSQKIDTTKTLALAAKRPAEHANAAFDRATPGTSTHTRLSRLRDRYADRLEYLELSVEENTKKLETLKNNTNFNPNEDSHWLKKIPNAPSTVYIALAMAVVTGLLCGLVNGIQIAVLRVVPFIVTLGTMTVFLGIAYLLAPTPIRPSTNDQVPFFLQDMVSTSTNAFWFGLAPTAVFLAIALAVVLALVLRYSVFGRYVFAIGSNEATAAVCGINVTRNKIAVYVLAGLFFGIAGICQFAIPMTGSPSEGVGLELSVIAAVVIGGGSLSGGRGSVIGTLAGACIMSAIINGCTHMGLQIGPKYVILGISIIAAATIDQLRHQRLSKD